MDGADETHGPRAGRRAPAGFAETSRGGRDHRWVRRLRRLLVGLLAALLVLTVASLIFNATTRPPDRLQPTEGTDVTLATGVRVHYLAWGASGTAVVLVHGFAESGVSWTPTAQALARDHRVYAIDLAGYGYTDYTGHYTLADEVALLDDFLHALHVTGATLVGHSMGAAVVGGVGLWHPTDVRGIVMLDGDGLPFTNQGASRTGSRSWLTRGPWFTSAYRIATRWHWLDEMLVRTLCGSRCLAVTPDLVTAWMRPLRQGDAERALTQQAGSGVLALTAAQERAITVPRGIVWGSEDGSAGGSRSAVEDNLGHPRSITITGAGHLSQVADPDAVCAAIEAIMAGWPAT